MVDIYDKKKEKETKAEIRKTKKKAEVSVESVEEE